MGHEHLSEEHEVSLKVSKEMEDKGIISYPFEDVHPTLKRIADAKKAQLNRNVINEVKESKQKSEPNVIKLKEVSLLEVTTEVIKDTLETKENANSEEEEMISIEAYVVAMAKLKAETKAEMNRLE